MLTYRRPDCLARIIPHLVAQVSRIGAGTRVLIIDNDPARSAEEVVKDWASSGVEYFHEPRPGIAAARNRALDESRDADALVFIDDDELPSEDWLARLVSCWLQWKCAAVAGPVVARFEVPASEWILASRAFARRTHPTGVTVPGAATNNLLLDLATVRILGLRFDESFGLTGGEDTLFTHELVHRGGQIRWCDEAEVIEPVPAGRINRRWVLRRTFRAGTSWARMELAIADGRFFSVRRRVSLLVRGSVKLSIGMLILAEGVARRNVARQARGTCVATSYAGMLAGTFGYTYEEYGRRP